MRLSIFLSCAIALIGCDIDHTKTRAESEQFSIGHAEHVLTESIGIETLGGVFTPLIDRGTQIPVTIKQVFSTAEDNQTAVAIHVLAGNSEMAKNNRTIGRFQVDGIPPAPRGVPQIEVAYTVDRDGNLSVKARDLSTGMENEIKILGVRTRDKD